MISLITFVYQMFFSETDVGWQFWNRVFDLVSNHSRTVVIARWMFLFFILQN